jgi:hypothetical protein
VAVTTPPQVSVTFGTLATTSVPVADGNESVNATPVRSPAAVVLELLIVKVTLVVPFRGMLAAPNALLIVGGATTVMLAFEVPPVTPPPFVAVGVTLLFFTPAVVPVMFTDKVQFVAGAILAPDKLTEEEPATAVATPPHVLLRLFGVATTGPAGRLSVKATPLSVRF